jgi:hypothetical protein
MKKQLIAVMAAFLISVAAYGQGFVEVVEGNGLSGLFNNDCVLKLESGEMIHGKFASGTYVNNGFSKISLKLENGEKARFEPDQIISLHIKKSGLMKLFMVTDATASVKEMIHTDFNQLVNRDSVIFETAVTPKKKETRRILQLLNPGFDSKIKVYAEPNAKTGGLNVGGLQLTGGEDKAYLFVKNGEKAFQVKKGSYARNFEELYSDCPKMLEAFKDQKIKWDDVALHVYAYDQLCKEE